MSARPGTALAGTRVTLSATVRSTGSTPAGTVSFTTGSRKLCSAHLSRGSAHCTATFPAAGGYTVKRAYSGDSTHAGSSGITHVTVAKAKTATQIISIKPGSVHADVPATVTVKVTTPAGTPAATGTVKVAPTNVAAPVPASYSCTATLRDGTGSCKVTPPNPSFGIIIYQARHVGDAAHTGSVSTTKQLIVPDTTTTSVAFSPATGAVGTKETVTATVVNEAKSDISPKTGGTGTVTFTVGTTTVCSDVQLSYSPATGNTATCSFTPSATGSYTVKAAYSGDPLNQASSGTKPLSVS